MANKSADSLKNMCRTCMSAFSNVLKSNSTMNKQCIYEVPIGSEGDTSLIELLQIVQPQIKVQIKDNLPKLMCSDCIKKLQETHAFLEMYKDVDKKFRKMLKEINTTNYLKLFDETLEFIEEKDIEDNLDDEDEIHEITKFEIEIEKINDEGCDNVNVWPEFEEEPMHEISDEDVEKNELFDNPYSDASDNESEQNDTRCVCILHLNFPNFKTSIILYSFIYIYIYLCKYRNIKVNMYYIDIKNRAYCQVRVLE